MPVERLDLDAEWIEIPVTIRDKKGVVTNYVLREADGDASCQYKNAAMACTKLGPEGKPSAFVGLADVEPLLVSLCLFPENSDTHVPLKVVRALPDKTIKKLFETLTEISNLENVTNDEETLRKQNESAKNSLNGIGSGSG